MTEDELNALRAQLAERETASPARRFELGRELLKSLPVLIGERDRLRVSNGALIAALESILPELESIGPLATFEAARATIARAKQSGQYGTERSALLAMLGRAGIGHGLRHDYNPPGEAVQVENDADDSGQFVTEFAFDDRGALKSVHCYEHQNG